MNKEIKMELLAIKEDSGVSLKELKDSIDSLIFDEKQKIKEEKRKQHSILTNEKTSEYNIKANRDKVFSDIDKMLNDFSNQNKNNLDETRNDGFVLGGGRRHIYLDNVGFSGGVYDTTNDPITTNSTLFYELLFRTNNLFVKISTFYDIVSDIAKYFNINNLTYLDTSVAGYYQEKSKEIPNENITINYISLDININKKTILISYHNTKDDIKQAKTEEKFKKQLAKIGVTEEEFYSVPCFDWTDEWKSENADLIKKLKKLDLKGIDLSCNY